MRKCIAVLCIVLGTTPLDARSGPFLKLVLTIPLDGVEGRIDHFSVDLQGRRLFMSALGNNTVEVFDLEIGQRTHTLVGLREPQGVLYAPGVNRIFVANGQGGAVKIFDSNTFELAGAADFSDDADNLRYDPGPQLVYVGFGEGGLGLIDAGTGNRLGEIRLAAHPESFQLARSGPRIFVNVPTAHQIAVIDRGKQAVEATWPLPGYEQNFPMALDEAHGRLFVVCRKPPTFLVFDEGSGKILAALPCTADADDMFYDAARKRLYISGGGGFLTVIEQLDADHYEFLKNIATAPGARTSYFVPGLKRLYLAVPHRGKQKAELRIYETTP